MRFLIIDDEILMANALAILLKSHNYAVDFVLSCQEALNSRDLRQYDLIICDYLFSDMNGQEFVEEIRKNNISIPILILSAISDSNNKSKLLNSGADDYLTKPFSGDELIARVKTLLRRRCPLKKECISFADLQFNLNSCEVNRNGRIINLRNKELSLLKYLLENQGHTCTRQLIIENVWDEAACHLSNTLEAHILNLRKQIDFKKPTLIHTVCGQGYKIDYKL